MNFGTQARADWRALISAAFIGSGVGLALGGLYLGAGMGRAVIDHTHAVQAQELAQALRGPLAAEGFAPAAQAGEAPAAAQLAEAKPTRARELDCLAQAVYFEARGESARGQAAVATVIMNRVKNPNFPKTVCGVVYQGAGHRNGCQFSFACDGQVERVVEATAWSRARQVAARVLSGAVLRDVGSATHFHTTAVAPEWGGRMLRVAQVGLHVFYRFNPHAPRPVLEEPDDSVQFASTPAPVQTQLRLAAAVVVPTPAADPAAKPALGAPAAVAVEAKPADKAAEAKPAAKPEAPALPIAKIDAPANAKPAAPTAS